MFAFKKITVSRNTRKVLKECIKMLRRDQLGDVAVTNETAMKLELVAFEKYLKDETERT